MSYRDFFLRKSLQTIMPGGKEQLITLVLTFINGLVFSFILLPFLIDQFGLRPIDTVGEHYLMVPGLLKGRGLIWGADGGMGFMMAKEPGYTIFLAMIFKLFGTLDIRLVQLSQVIINTSICWLVWIIGYISTARRYVANMAAIVYAFHPLALLYTARIWNDIPSSFWVTLSVWLFLLTLRDKSILKGLLAGCSLAIAVLFRTASFWLIFVFIAWLFLDKYVLVRESHSGLSLPITQKVKIAMGIALMFFLVLSPWAIRNFMLSGRPVMLVTIQSWATWIDGGELVRLWNRKENIWSKDTEVKKFSLIKELYNEEKRFGFTPDQVELRVHDRLRTIVITEILEDPSGYAKRIAKSALLFWFLGTHKVLSFSMLFVNILLVPLAIIGAIFALRKGNANLVILVSTMMYFWIIYAMVISYCRYSVPVIPFVIILASYASVSLYAKMKDY